MSLESEVAVLVAVAGENLRLPQQLAETARAQIAAVSAAYQSAIANADVTRFVNQATGSDAADGKAPDRSYKTLQRALNDGVPGGLVTAIITGDYVMNEHVLVSNRKARIMNINNTPFGSSAGPRGNITFMPYADIPTGVRCLKRFTVEGDAALTLNYLKLNVPDTTGYGALARDHRSALVSAPDGQSTSIFVRFALALLNCDLAIPSSPFGAVVAADLAQLYANSIVASGQPLPGRLFERYQNTNGTSVLNVPDVFTNLLTI